MKNVLKLSALLLAVMGLSACSSLPQKYQVFRSNTHDYLKAKTVPPLRIPPGYASGSVEDYYPVPNAQQALLSNKSPILSPPNINPKDAPPKESWFKKWFPHAAEPWDKHEPKKNNS